VRGAGLRARRASSPREPPIGCGGEDRQAGVGGKFQALEVEAEVADDGVVEVLDIGLSNIGA
jgi:hypothetical protein